MNCFLSLPCREPGFALRNWACWQGCPLGRHCLQTTSCIILISVIRWRNSTTKVYILHPDWWNQYRRNWACWQGCPLGRLCLQTTSCILIGEISGKGIGLVDRAVLGASIVYWLRPASSYINTSKLGTNLLCLSPTVLFHINILRGRIYTFLLCCEPGWTQRNWTCWQGCPLGRLCLQTTSCILIGEISGKGIGLVDRAVLGASIVYWLRPASSYINTSKLGTNLLCLSPTVLFHINILRGRIYTFLLCCEPGWTQRNWTCWQGCPLGRLCLQTTSFSSW